MKVLLKVTGLVLVILTMVYNINISMSKNNQRISLAYVRNQAQAQNENTTGYLRSDSASGHSTLSHVNSDNTICSEDFDFTKTVCSGQGPLNCVNSYEQKNVKYTGNCPFH